MRSVNKLEPAPFREAVFICSKCAAKLGRGRKGKTELRGEMKHALKAKGLSKTVQIVETTCLDLCPKGGQTIATLELLAQGELAVFDGSADGEDVVARLFGDQRPTTERHDRSADLLPQLPTGTASSQTV